MAGSVKQMAARENPQTFFQTFELVVGAPTQDLSALVDCTKITCLKGSHLDHLDFILDHLHVR